MSAREQADSVSQSRKVFNRSLCRLFLKEKEHWGEWAGGKKWREGRGKGWGGGWGNFTQRLLSHQLLLDVDQVDGYLCF